MTPSTEPVLQLIDATVVKNDRRVLDGLTLTILAGEHTAYGGEVKNVGPDEIVPAVAPRPVLLEDVIQALEISGVGEEIQIHDVKVRLMRQEPAHEVHPNETRAPGDHHAAGYKPSAHRSLPRYSGRSAMASGGKARSLSDKRGVVMGHAIPSAGSFQAIPRSSSDT